MTTHRIMQLHNLRDTMLSKARIARRAAKNLDRINNRIGAGHYLRAANRYDCIARKALSRINARMAAKGKGVNHYPKPCLCRVKCYV